MEEFTLSEGVIVRREWFGCLLCHTLGKGFFQFNEDAFEIFKELKNPINLIKLCEALERKKLEISEKDLGSFLSRMQDLDLVIQANQSQGALFFYEDKTEFREDCLVAPSSATIYITDYCTKRCRHCVTRSSPHVDRTGEYSVEQWNMVMRKLRDFGVCTLVFSGGEPLVKKGIFEILRIADKLKFAICLLTDYDEINDEHLAQLKTLKRLHDLQISLDGGTEQTHDSIRGKGSFRLALHRMSLLCEHGFKYTISTVVSKRNMAELNQIVELYREYGAGYLYLNPLSPYGRAKEQMQKEILSDEDLRWLAQEYLRLLAEGVNSGNPFWEENITQLGNEDFHPFKGALTAMSIGVYNFAIGSKGECYLDSKMKSEELLCLGNILEDNLEAMWYSPRLDHLRKQYSPDLFTYTDQSNVRPE